MMPRSPSGRRGFTLIELLVSMGIMLFVITVTVIAFTPAFGGAGLRSAARVVSAAADGARVRAIQQRRQVRFEARRILSTTKVQWQVCSTAGEVGAEWKDLPDFIVIETNVESGSCGTDGRGGTFSDANQRISLSFGPDGSVVRCSVGPNSDGAFSNTVEPTTAFALRLQNIRDSVATEDRPTSWLVVIPLTGAIQSVE